MSKPDPFVATLAFAEVLHELRIPYVVGGSLASILHGELRLTNDIDIAIAQTSGRLDALARLLEREFVVDCDAMAKAQREQSSFGAIYRSGVVFVDVEVRALGGHFAEQLKRAQKQPIGAESNQFAFFCTAEDAVLQKLGWCRSPEGVSEGEWRDVLGVLKHSRERVDISYLREWAATLGVTALLQRALVESGLG